MVTSAGITFAQASGGSNALKDRIHAQKDLKAEREAELVTTKLTFETASRTSERSDFVRGVVRIKNGTPFIALQGTNSERQMIPTNLHKAMAKDGQELMFSYTVSEVPFARNNPNVQSITLFDVSTPAKK